MTSDGEPPEALLLGRGWLLWSLDSCLSPLVGYDPGDISWMMTPNWAGEHWVLRSCSGIGLSSCGVTSVTVIILAGRFADNRDRAPFDPSWGNGGG